MTKRHVSPKRPGPRPTEIFQCRYVEWSSTDIPVTATSAKRAAESFVSTFTSAPREGVVEVIVRGGSGKGQVFVVETVIQFKATKAKSA